MFIGLCFAFLAFVSDQLSKFFVFEYAMEHGALTEVTGFFNIVTAFNKGISFSMFDSTGGWGRVILIVVACAIIVFLLCWMKNETSRFVRICLGLIVGGAVGNLVDRVRLGAVYDFLDFHVNAYHWPAFNLADSFICVGALLIVCHALVCKIKGV